MGDSLQWRFGYRATASYGALLNASQALGYLDSSAFVDLKDDMIQGRGTWNTYADWYKTLYANDLQKCTNSSGSIDHTCIKAYTCALEVYSKEDYATCAGLPASAHHEFEAA